MFGFKSARKDDTEEATGLFASLRQRLSKTREKSVQWACRSVARQEADR